MFVSPTALKIACELALAGVAGLVAMMAFVVLTVDRLNVRVAELEAQVAGRGGPPPARSGRRPATNAPEGPVAVARRAARSKGGGASSNGAGDRRQAPPGRSDGRR